MVRQLPSSITGFFILQSREEVGNIVLYLTQLHSVKYLNQYFDEALIELPQNSPHLSDNTLLHVHGSVLVPHHGELRISVFPGAFKVLDKPHVPLALEPCLFTFIGLVTSVLYFSATDIMVELDLRPSLSPPIILTFTFPTSRAASMASIPIGALVEAQAFFSFISPTRIRTFQVLNHTVLYHGSPPVFWSGLESSSAFHIRPKDQCLPTLEDQHRPGSPQRMDISSSPNPSVGQFGAIIDGGD